MGQLLAQIKKIVSQTFYMLESKVVLEGWAVIHSKSPHLITMNIVVAKLQYFISVKNIC